MAAENYSHQDYVDAFQQFMRTGERDQLDSYLDGNRRAGFLSVYRNGFIRASASALESNFPSVVKLWGEEYFAQVAAAYVSVAPPVSATLIGYGFAGESEEVPSFVDFLREQLADVIKQYPYVPDLCQLDQAWLQTLNKNGDEFLSLEQVQALIAAGEDLAERPMTLVDSATIINLEFDLFELWSQLRFGQITDDQQIALTAEANAIIFWQMNLQVQAKPMSAVETAFMVRLRETASFDEATNVATGLDDTFDVSTLFAELLNAHLLK
ncbi:DUF2063 domain-containing protein [Leucothrix sargassi]|nr:DUF2063 domain-containing protein [Leucothrix sargassi]